MTHELKQASGAVAGYARDHAMLPTEPAARQLEIPHQLERLERTLKGCMQGLDTLNDRLSTSILASEPPNKTSDPRGGELMAAPRSHLGSRIQELTSVTAMVNERIQGLIARLEA